MAMKAYNEQDHREALLLRRLKFLLSYPSALIQSLPNKKAFREVILEKLRHPPWEMMKKSKDYDDWLCSLVKADCWQPFAARTLERERWGVFANILNIALYEILWCRELTTEEEWRRIHPWLHLPLDDHVMEHLHQLDPAMFPSGSWFPSNVTEERYMKVQRAARVLASRLKQPAIWFEDAWSLYQ